MLRFIFPFCFISTIILSCNSRKQYTQLQLKSAWYLYAMNFQYGDSAWVKTQIPIKDYKQFIVELDAFPFFQDTLQDGNILIFYTWVQNNIQLKPSTLTYNGLELNSSGEIVKLYAGDVGIIYTQKNDGFVAYESMIKYIQNESTIAPGVMFKECFNAYKSGAIN